MVLSVARFPFKILKERPYDLALAIEGIEQCLKRKKKYKLGKKILKKWFSLLVKYFVNLNNYPDSNNHTTNKYLIDPTVLASSFHTLEAQLDKYNITKKLNLSWSFLSNVINKEMTNPKYQTFFNELLSRYKKSSSSLAKNDRSYILSSIISAVHVSPMDAFVFDRNNYKEFFFYERDTREMY